MSWTRVQGFQQTAQFNNGGPYANTQVTLGSSVSIGDTLCVATTTASDQTGGGPTLIDQLGNTYVLKQATYEAANDTTWLAWLCIVTVGGTPTLTFDPGVSNQNWLGIFGDHFTGSDAFSVARDSKSATQVTPGTGTDAVTTASLAAQSGDLEWGHVGDNNISVGGTVAIGTGYSTAINFNSVVRTEYKTAAGAGAVTFTDATNGSSHNYSTGGIAVTPATIASGGGSARMGPGYPQRAAKRAGLWDALSVAFARPRMGMAFIPAVVSMAAIGIGAGHSTATMNVIPAYAANNVFLRSVPTDPNQNDVRLWTPTAAAPTTPKALVAFGVGAGHGTANLIAAVASQHAIGVGAHIGIAGIAAKRAAVATGVGASVGRALLYNLRPLKALSAAASVGTAAITAKRALVGTGVGSAIGTAAMTAKRAMKAVGVGAGTATVVVNSGHGQAQALGVGAGTGTALVTAKRALAAVGEAAGIGRAALTAKRAAVAVGIGSSAGMASLTAKRALFATGIAGGSGTALAGVRRQLKAVGVGASIGTVRANSGHGQTAALGVGSGVAMAYLSVVIVLPRATDQFITRVMWDRGTAPRTGLWGR